MIEKKIINFDIASLKKLETDISGFLDGKGIAGSWGTNQPEKGKMIFETVGLGIYVPNNYIKDGEVIENIYSLVNQEFIQKIQRQDAMTIKDTRERKIKRYFKYLPYVKKGPLQT